MLPHLLKSCSQVVESFPVYEGQSTCPTQAWFFEEHLNHTKYFKYTGNAWFKVDKGLEANYDHQVMHALSHWSYENSHGKCLLADLQGVGIVLTDPLIVDNSGKVGFFFVTQHINC